MIHLMIDGNPVEVEKGTTILHAAKKIGVKIPTLCYIENLLPDGSCRLCVVEVKNNGRTKIDTACTLQASEGDEVFTMSEKVIQSRKQTLDLLLSDHNIHCFSCEGNGDCKLQDYAYEYGLDCSSYEGEKSGGEIDDSNKFFTYDPSLCILCHRCVNTCNEIVGRGAIATMERGFQSIIGNGEGKWADGTCESCGNCVQACPTGALTMKRRKKYFLVASASIAASFLICISTIYFLNQNGSVNLDFQAIAEEMDSQSVEEVTLITSKEQLNLDEDVFIKYSKEGKVAVNSQVIKEKEEKTKEEQEYNQLLVPAGKRARVELSDGTRLVVNSQSKVIYPRCFKGDIRKIYAQGEVFLEVAHDKKHPFIVESDDFKLQVLGTKFNISNYKGGTTNIVLVEGAVEVTDKNEKKARLNPNDLLNIANGTIAYQKQVDVAEYISWVEGIMLLNGNDLSQIIQRLSIYYGISIQCDPIIGKEKVYGKLDLKDDIDEVIECIQQTLPFTIEKSDTSIYLNKYFF